MIMLILIVLTFFLQKQTPPSALRRAARDTALEAFNVSAADVGSKRTRSSARRENEHLNDEEPLNPDNLSEIAQGLLLPTCKSLYSTHPYPF